MKTITITVDPRGGTKVETTGFAGQACKDATRGLERALGQVTDERLTAEYHAGATSAEQTHRPSA